MERLYNNILLQDDFWGKPSDAQHIPYLENPPTIIDVSIGRQLFIDNFLIEETDLQPYFHKAIKYEGNPILFAQVPWEIEQSPVAAPKSGGVWYDEEDHLFKMWYEGGWLRHMCYAVSRDGINWKRQDLGIVPKTNIILPYDGYSPEKYSSGLDYLRPDSTTVFIDYDCPKEEKYKLFMRNPGETGPGIVAISADGIHFHHFGYTSNVDDRSTVFYNPFRKKWVYSIRSAFEQKGSASIRIRKYRECDDFLQGANWEPCDSHFWLQCDELDKPNPYIGESPQLYNVDCIGYESIMLGMFQIHYGPNNRICEEHGVPKMTELIPMYSRDGYHFSRPNRECIVNASMYRGAWDRGYVQSVGGVAIIHHDELWIYYAGFAGDEHFANQSWITNGIYRNGATGLAKIRRDGFISLHGNGSVLTRKMTFSQKTSFHINAKGSVWAEVLDECGNNLGKTNTFSGDSTNAELRIEKLNVADLNDRVLRLRFYVQGDLYSFGFADKTGDFGGAHAAGCVES